MNARTERMLAERQDSQRAQEKSRSRKGVLYLVGIVGGFVFAGVMVATGGDDAPATTRAATQFGNTGIRLLAAAAALGGGWAVWRRKK